MNKYQWIIKKGTNIEEEVTNLIYKKMLNFDLFLAYSVDSFLSGHSNEKELKNINISRLLEIRLFSKEQELCIRRSHVGEPFQWRVASEADLSDTDYMISNSRVVIKPRFG